MLVPLWTTLISVAAGIILMAAAVQFQETLQTIAPWAFWGGLGVLVVSLVGLFVSLRSTRRATRKSHSDQVRVGDDSVVMGDVSGAVGDRSVVVSATDDRGNTILNQPMAVGHKAHAGPGSIAVGANAGAGSTEKTHVNEESDQAPPRTKK